MQTIFEAIFVSRYEEEEKNNLKVNNNNRDRSLGTVGSCMKESDSDQKVFLILILMCKLFKANMYPSKPKLSGICAILLMQISI